MFLALRAPEYERSCFVFLNCTLQDGGMRFYVDFAHRAALAALAAGTFWDQFL